MGNETGDYLTRRRAANYDTLSPKRHGNVLVMGRGFSDEAIVIIKSDADEVMVT